ncbi:MAG: hypothetical protein M1541_09560 [Acidobacteria bacterium]|nr:hypothetical protein [Acidobacteriota bacterium]
MKPRLLTALLSLAVLALLAAATLEGTFRIAVWIFLGGLAVKTWIATLKEKASPPTDPNSPPRQIP